MFTNILFLILALLMSALAPLEENTGLIASPWLSFATGIALWVGALGVIFLLHRLLHKTGKDLLANVLILTLLFSLAFAHFFVVYLKPFAGMPIAIGCAITLTLYLAGIAWIYFLMRGRRAARQNVLFLLPFALPFLALTALMDTPLFQSDSWTTVTLATLATVGLLIVFFPFLLRRIWQCQPFRNEELHQRLEALCQKLKFRHAGLQEWKLMQESYTAAIIGIVPRYRYVMFTEKLLSRFTPEWTEAILAHEIGHSKHRHLLYYPFITFGIVLSTGILVELLSGPLATLFTRFETSYPWPYWNEMYTFTLFLLFGSTLAVALRLLFGKFSRLFERQADLYVFDAGIDAQYMIAALNEIGTLAGNIHSKPNWHHHSIEERIDFLSRASCDPKVIAKHHQTVRQYLWGYSLFLTALIIIAQFFLKDSL